jgi:hypothetical protein
LSEGLGITCLADKLQVPFLKKCLFLGCTFVPVHPGYPAISIALGEAIARFCEIAIAEFGRSIYVVDLVDDHPNGHAFRLKER